MNLWDGIDKRGPTDCWPWTASTDSSGYGHIRVDGKLVGAHRAVYVEVIGPIPEGMQVDHTCHNADVECPGGVACPHRRCCNPAHLEAVTRVENQRRGRNPRAVIARERARATKVARTHCKHGHPYDEANTRYDPSGARVCRACAAARRQYERKRVNR